MKILALLCVTLTLSCAMFIVDDEESDDTSIDLYETDTELDVQHKGYCRCCSHGCWCHARHVKIAIMYDETEPGHEPQVLATFQIRAESFTKKFDVNKTETHCMKVKRKEYCFEFDVKEKMKEEDLPTCIKMKVTKLNPKREYKPKEVDFGCVKLPLMTIGNDVIVDDSYDEEDYDLFFE